MTANEFIKKLESSANEVLEANAKDMVWAKLRHSKSDLETFLNYNIAHLSFRPTRGREDKEIVACSNTALIAAIQLKRNDTKKIVQTLKMASRGIRTRNPDSILTWDFIDNDYCTVSLKNWTIHEWITVSKENIPVVNRILRRLLGYDTD